MCQNVTGTCDKMSHPYNLISYRVSNIFMYPPIGNMETTSMNNIRQASLSDILVTAKKPGRKTPRHKRGERFLKGPVPWDWVVKAANISGAALTIGLAIWFIAGISNTRTIKLSNGILDELGVSRRTKYRSLKAMENAGLITISQLSGNSPEIKINGANQ